MGGPKAEPQGWGEHSAVLGAAKLCFAVSRDRPSEGDELLRSKRY